MSVPIRDATERLRALDPRRSFCVQAPAGSGKTELLTQRILNLLAHCERPEEILAFTFTRKAAAEMRKRLLDALEAAEGFMMQEGAVETRLAALPAHRRQTMELALAALAQDRLLGWDLLQNSQRLRINTIDSFSAWLTARLPLQAGFGSRPELATDVDAVFGEAVRLTLDALEEGGAGAAQVENLLRHLHGNLRRAEALLLQLLHKRDQWLPLVGALGQDLQQARALLEANLATLLDELTDEAHLRLIPYESTIMELLGFAAAQPGNKQAALLQGCGFGSRFPPPQADAAAQWQVLAQFFLTADCKGLRKAVNVNHGFPAAKDAADKEQARHFGDMKSLFGATVENLSAAGLLPLLQRLAQLPPAAYAEPQWDTLAAAIGLLPLLAARLRLAMMRHGLVDHTENALAALQALGNETTPTDLALQLDYRIHHILVDEFQDTSSTQFRLIELLTAGWTEGDGRSLFIVGDGMQSCYGFRNANVGLFLRAREQVANLPMELLQLQVNFRSSPQVVEWVNQVFAGAFPAEDDIARGGVSYSPSTAAPAATASSGVHVRLLVQDPDLPLPAAAVRAHEAGAVAELCQRLLAEHPQDQVAILVRNRTALGAIVPALRQAGLRWNAEDIDPLLSYPPIMDLFTLLRAFLHVADDTAWLALLRCPFIGLELHDLEALALFRNSKACTVYSALQQPAALAMLSTDGQARLQRCVPVLQTARAHSQLLPLDDLLEQLWIALGGPACLDDAGMLDNIDSFLQLVAETGRHGDIPDIHHLHQRLQQRYGSSQEPGVRLQIMTMHKSKGLEFDHVILPGLDRKPRNDSDALLLWQEYIARDSHPRILLALLGSKGADSDPLHDYLKREATLRNRLESTRLLYIAVTRAEKSAWLFGTAKAGKSGLAAPAGSLLQAILPQLEQDGHALQVEQGQLELPQQQESHGTATAALPVFRRLPAGWTNPATGLLLPPAPCESPEATHDLLAACIGELVHQSLQSLVEYRRHDPAAVLPAEPAWWRSRLRPLCEDPGALEAALHTVASQVRRCLDDAANPWLFVPQQEDACELALSSMDNGERRDYSIDRTFVRDGLRWIIDYKSAQPAPGQSMALFLQEQTVRYLPQLARYAQLLRAIDARPLCTALYFTALPCLHLVSTDP